MIAKKERYGIPLETVVCEKCGLIFSLNQMDETSTTIFYSEYYRPIYGGIINPTINKWGNYYKKRGRVPKFLHKKSVIVEIGSGGGWNLLKFKNRGFQHYGFDYDPNLIEFGKKEYDLNLMYGSIGEAIRIGVKADYCILSHVLEHTLNPIHFLSEVKRIMSEKSIVKVTVPNANMLVIGGFDLLGTLQNAHNYLFDEFTLKYAALKSGFGVYACAGEYIILRKDYYRKEALKCIEDALSNKYRGNKVIKYLKLCEKMVPLKNYFVKPKISQKLFYLYLASKPIELTKLFWVLNNPHLLHEKKIL